MSVHDTPVAGPLQLQGAAGRIEALLETPSGAVQSVAVLCHPHPLFGGAMTNKVVHIMAKACVDSGAAAIRFNFRGVGASEGEHDAGQGETVDTIKVIEWARRQWPDKPLWLGGFSFGGAVAIRAASQVTVERLITVAPAVQKVTVETERLPQCPWLVIQGDSDDVVEASLVLQWIDALSTRPEVALLSDAGHFFHGRLNDLRDAVVGWLQRGV